MILPIYMLPVLRWKRHILLFFYSGIAVKKFQFLPILQFLTKVDKRGTLQGILEIPNPEFKPGACNIKLFKAVIYGFP